MTDYRLDDFRQLMEHNLLRLSKSTDRLPLEKLPHGGEASSLLERQTRYFPYTDQETILFGLKQAKDLESLLDPVKHFFTHDEHDEDQLETVIAVELQLI